MLILLKSNLSQILIVNDTARAELTVNLNN